MQEVDAERRIQLLRGFNAPTSAPQDETAEHTTVNPEIHHSRKRKRRPGEDDTERDIRLAREDADDRALRHQPHSVPSHKHVVNAPLTDRRGHISLFPEERARSHVSKNPEAEAETAKKKREYEDQYTMRFSNAAGYNQGMESPWYAAPDQSGSTERPRKERDRWGNNEFRRQERQEAKRDAEDPLASMRKGVGELKRAEKERKMWVESREKESWDIGSMEKKSRRKSSRHHRSEIEDDIEPLSLEEHIDARRSRHRSPDGTDRRHSRKKQRTSGRHTDGRRRDDSREHRRRRH